MLLPGMMLDARMYQDQAAVLGSNMRVTVADLTCDDTIGAMAQRVLDQAPSRFALVGLSMGGIVAFEIWRRARERVTHLALLDTTPHADREERQRQRGIEIAQAAAGLLYDVVASSMKPHYLSPSRRDDTALRQSIIDQAMSLGPDVFGRQSRALRDRPDSVATVSTIDCPALVLCGRDDALCPVDVHVAMARAMPHADLSVIADCGHLSAMEAPVAVTLAIEYLLARTT
jgi:pimeloyl-ACP methyl ester carboxylesterase